MGERLSSESNRVDQGVPDYGAAMAVSDEVIPLTPGVQPPQDALEFNAGRATRQLRVGAAVAPGKHVAKLEAAWITAFQILDQALGKSAVDLPPMALRTDRYRRPSPGAMYQEDEFLRQDGRTKPSIGIGEE